MRGKHPFWGVIVAFLLIVISISPQMRSLYAMPDRVVMRQDGGVAADLVYPLTLSWELDQQDGALMTAANREASQHLVVRLFDFVPIKRVAVDMKPPIKVMVGGHSIGVTMQMSGVLVVGFSSVTDASGNTQNPAKDAGVKMGDRIVALNERYVSGDEEVAQMVHQVGKEGAEIALDIVRDGELLTKRCRVVYSYETQSYRIGLFVRDTAVGIGTLTYYEPTTNTYGALGHIITDSDTNEEVACASGEIVPANVAMVQQSESGQPGEKIGAVTQEKTVWGTIEKNTPCGIYGKMTVAIDNPIYPKAVPVAAGSQIREGDAKMLTVVDGEQIEAFDVTIEKINVRDRMYGKNMVIRIIDPKLIARTGGIIQGMSGSPIIQDGRLIGAITHVFVNDPTKGYGIFIENMIETAR